jgi:hypothetical protein
MVAAARAVGGIAVLQRQLCRQPCSARRQLRSARNPLVDREADPALFFSGNRAGDDLLDIGRMISGTCTVIAAPLSPSARMTRAYLSCGKVPGLSVATT